jgi:exopolysaccharide production protein ExoY
MPKWLTSAGNLRGHFLRALVRLLMLLVADYGAVALGRWVIRVLRGSERQGLADYVGLIVPASAVTIRELFPAVVIGMFAVGAYRAGDYWRDPARILGAMGVGVALTLYGDLWQGTPLVVAAGGLLIWASLGLAVVAVRTVLGRVVRRMRRHALEHRVLEIGDIGGAHHRSLGPGYKTVARLNATEIPADVEEMTHWLDGGVDTIVVRGAFSAVDFGRLTDFAVTHGCRLLCGPRCRELGGMDPRRVWLRGAPYSELNAPELRASQTYLKRLVDIAGSTLLVLALSPVLLAIAIAVKLDSPGPVLFRHRRAGYRGMFFQLLKFRSMRCEAEKLLAWDAELYDRYRRGDFKLSVDEDPRITRVGKFLRKTSLDELPQLLNVLKGDMSLVGPRPVVEPELMMYEGRIATFLSVKPGMTGLWQVSGRSRIMFPERAELDLDYVRNWSLLRDFWILLMTVPAVVLQRGAH